MNVNIGRLTKRITDFLKEQRPIADSGWSEPTKEDITQLIDIIHTLIIHKFAADADGDWPLEFILINRATHERLPYWPVRYEHKIANPQERLDYERAIAGNLQTAAHATDIYFRLMEMRRR